MNLNLIKCLKVQVRNFKGQAEEVYYLCRNNTLKDVFYPGNFKSLTALTACYSVKAWSSMLYMNMFMESH